MGWKALNRVGRGLSPCQRDRRAWERKPWHETQRAAWASIEEGRGEQTMKQSSSWRHTEHPIDTGSPRGNRSAETAWQRVVSARVNLASNFSPAFGACPEYPPAFPISSYSAKCLLNQLE